MSNISFKNKVKQPSKLLFDKCTENIEGKPKQFLVEIFSNTTIRKELENIIDKSPIFNQQNSEEHPSSLDNENNRRSYVEQREEVNEEENKSQEEQKIKEKLEDGDNSFLPIQSIQSNSTSLIEENQENVLKWSVFSDIHVKDQIHPLSSLSTNQLSLGIPSQSSISLSSKISSHRKSIAIMGRKKKPAKSKINENANFGSPPSSTTSSIASFSSSASTFSSDPSTAWLTVNDWLYKAVKKIQKYTSDFITLLSKKFRSILVEFGILILGIALLYSAGLISNPSFYFRLFYESLLSLVSSFF